LIATAPGEPLFRSVNHALAFAHNFTHGTLKRTGLQKMMGGPVKSGRGLAGLDGAAQAAIIKSMIEAMPKVYSSTLIARFAPQQDECSCGRSCCRGWKESEDWARAIDWLAAHVYEIGLCAGIGHWKFRRSVLMRYFGSSISFLTIANECGVHRHTASELNLRIVDYFRGKSIDAKKGVEWRARIEFEGKLAASGLI
jgi:hypothetical protein